MTCTSTFLKRLSPWKMFKLYFPLARRLIDPENLGHIPSNAIVVHSALQIELLKRAALCITHAGLNTNA
jgi:zeaxanthin glucosyltransferase